MPVNVVCPRLHCRAVLRVPDEVRGKRVRCSLCQATFIVPKRKAESMDLPGTKTEAAQQTADEKGEAKAAKA